MVKGKRNENPTGKKKANGADPPADQAQASPPKDHNEKTGLLLTEANERAAYWAHHVKRPWMKADAEIDNLNAQIDDIKERKKQVAKEAKARLGVNRKDIDFGIAISKSLDDDNSGKTHIEEARRQKEILVWEGHPLGTQIEFNFDADRTPLNDRAFGEGFRLGRDGDENGDYPCTPPPRWAPEQAQHWIRGHHAGREVFMLMNLKVRNSEPSPDGNPWPDDQQVAQARTEPAGEPGPEPAAPMPEPIGDAPATSEAL
jgi:hypothetical protein